MSIFSNLFKKVTTDIKQELTTHTLLSNTKMLIGDINTVITGQKARVLANPIGVAKQIIQDIPVAIFGKQPNLIEDTKNIIKDTAHLVLDTGINIFNTLPSNTPAPDFQDQAGSINARPGKIITSALSSSGVTLGELSWLTYAENFQTNAAMQANWKLYNFTETVSAYDSNTYVNDSKKQIAVTFEGTSPNSALSPWILSKDAFTDVEIGLGVIPNQVLEGYDKFKTLMNSLQKDYGNKGYEITLAGHSLGGGLAEMMAGMYFIDTGVALPTIAQEPPGMLRQLKMYAEEQLLAGKSIHLPTGGTFKLDGGTLLQRANQAKAVVNTFSAQDFSNVINLLTEQDPVGQVEYNKDASKDGHVGVNVIVPAILTPRECLQDIDYEAALPINKLGLKTPTMPKDPLNILPGLSNIDLSRIDRHLPGQSEGLWSGSSLGMYDPNGDLGLGVQFERTNGAPIQEWAGSQLTVPEVKIFGSSVGQVIDANKYVTGKQNAMVVSSSGNDTIYGSNNGDMLIGGSGNDTIYGGNGDNYISGGSGNDKLYGGSGNDIIYAGSGNTYLTGGGGNNLLFGGTGNDTFYWADGNDIMYNGQAGGNYDFIIANGAKGNSQLKWQRNFANIGNSTVEIQGAMDKSSHLMFNFVDEIRLKDINWSVNNNDIIMTDNLGNKPASVTIKNAFDAFGKNNDQIDFKFTNGHMYVDDETYHVRAGEGIVTAVDDNKYKGNILIGSSGDDILVAGKGNDILIGGAGTDTFVFNGSFGNDTIVDGNSQDTVYFNNIFAAAEFTTKQKGNDLVIDYQQKDSSAVNELTINNWFAAGDKVNNFAFADGSHYKIANNSFVKL